MPDTVQSLLRQLPSVADLLDRADVAALVDEYGAGMVKREIRSYLEDVRRAVRDGRTTTLPALDGLGPALAERLIRLTRPVGREAINATGIILHTGLGRAPLCDDALTAIADFGGYSILQTSIDTGERSLREEKIEGMLRDLTGCEAATVVNNNAAATFIILNELAFGREVVISRGQLVEIGGAFRLPDVMARSGCILREVGTTNRTYLRDYRDAIGDDTGAVMRAHTSNYRIRGFSSMPSVEELVPMAREFGLPVIDDTGSGALVPLAPFGLPDEPLIPHSIASGATVVCCSGDKLMSGPQAGIICGTRDVIARIRRNPFARTFRVDKMALAGLEATLVHFINGTHTEALPLYRMLSTPVDELEERARALMGAIDAPGVERDVVDDESFIGSGSSPDEGLPSKAVRLSGQGLRPSRVCALLRRGLPSVFARAHDDGVILAVRTVPAGKIDALAVAMSAALKKLA